mgnify:CR=1 FL=1
MFKQKFQEQLITKNRIQKQWLPIITKQKKIMWLENEEKLDSKYDEDGSFIGVANGYRPDLTVAVTIKNDKIVDIKIISHNESRGFYEEPFAVIPEMIIETQSLEVDDITEVQLERVKELKKQLKMH